jgi:hypothetical protein
MKSAFILILSLCLLSTITILAHAVKLVEEEEIYQTGRKEHRTATTENRTQARTQSMPENTSRTVPSLSEGSAKTKGIEKKAVPSKVVKSVKDEPVAQPKINIYSQAREWILSTYRGPWIPVWNWIFLLIGLLFFVKLGAEISIRLH